MHAIGPNQNSHSPTSIASADISIKTIPAIPGLAVREFFFSFLSDADRKRTDIGWTTTIRRFNEFIRFVSTVPEQIRGDSAKAGDKLVTAASKGDIAGVKANIAAHADINCADINGMTAIMYAAQNGNLEMLHALAAAGSAVDMRNNEGKTPLVLAMEKGHYGAMDFLIETGANIEKRDKNDLTPLMYSARHGNAKAVNFFLAKGAKAAIKNNDGWNALMLAALYGHQKIATAIMNGQAKQDIFELQVNSLVSAGRLSQFAVIHVIVHASQKSHYPLPPPIALVKCGLDGGMKLNFFGALADAGIRLSQHEYVRIVSLLNLHEVTKDCLLTNMVNGQPGFLSVVAKQYENDNNFTVDMNFNHPEPDLMTGNALGLRKQGILDFSAVSHSVDSAGQYRHAITELLQISPNPQIPIPLNGMLLTGWRSRITKLVYDAHKDLEAASSQAAELLAKPENGIVLIDQDGGIVASDSIRFKETLGGFKSEVQRLLMNCRIGLMSTRQSGGIDL